MNPWTLLKLWHGLGDQAGEPVYILQIAAVAHSWPQTIYKAARLGYLERTGAGEFKATEQLVHEVNKLSKLFSEQERAYKRKWRSAA